MEFMFRTFTSRDSSVGIATGYGFDGPGIEQFICFTVFFFFTENCVLCEKWLEKNSDDVQVESDKLTV
jgi:hypothetical protein